MASKPLQKFEPIDLWHFEVDEDNGRNRRARALGEHTGSLQVSDGLFTVLDELQVHGRDKLPQFPTDKELVVRVIICDQNCVPHESRSSLARSKGKARCCEVVAGVCVSLMATGPLAAEKPLLEDFQRAPLTIKQRLSSLDLKGVG